MKLTKSRLKEIIKEEVGKYHGMQEDQSEDSFNWDGLNFNERSTLAQSAGLPKPSKIAITSIGMLTPYEISAMKKVMRMRTSQIEEEMGTADDLLLFIENEPDLYHSQYLPIIKNLMAKTARGVYDSELAVKLFMYLVQNGAKIYSEKFGDANIPWHKMFPKVDRIEVAKELRDEFEEESKLGNYDELLPKKYKKKTKKKDIKEAGGGYVYEVFEHLKEMMGAESLLEELYQAMSSDEAMENFEHISRMQDIQLPRGDDEDEEDLEERVKPQKSIDTGVSGIELKGKGNDMNGNYRVLFSVSGDRSKSIQTNQNLPKSHRILKNYKTIKEIPQEELQIVGQEILNYLSKYGKKEELEEDGRGKSGDDVLPDRKSKASGRHK